MRNYIIRIILSIVIGSFNYAYTQVIASDDVILCDGQQGQTEITLTATSFAVDLTDSNIYTDDLFGSVIKSKLQHGFYPKKIYRTFGFYTTHSVGFFIKTKSQKKLGYYNLAPIVEKTFKIMGISNYSTIFQNKDDAISEFSSL